MTYLIERPGQKDKVGGMLSVLSGDAPEGLNAKDFKPGLDYYDANGVQSDMSKFMIRGDKGYYNLASIWARDPNAQTSQSAFMKYFAGDQTATDAMQKHFESYSKAQDLKAQTQGPWDRANNNTQAVGWEALANAKPNPGAVVSSFADAGPTPTPGIGNQVGAAPSPIDNLLSAINIAKAEDMPRFTSHEDMQSGGATQMANVRSRKSLGKPGGYGTPAFTLLSGAPPTDTLLGA